jgi:hypothetical protein
MSFQFYSMTFLTSLLQVFTTSCQVEKKLDFDYASGVCAPKLHPDRVHHGNFYANED